MVTSAASVTNRARTTSTKTSFEAHRRNVQGERGNSPIPEDFLVAMEEQEGEDLLPNAEQCQPVRDPLQDSDREEGEDPRPADRAIHRDAGEAREDPSMSG